MNRIKTVVLGAGGLVAQRLQQRLLHHPWFSLAGVAGSPRFSGRPLAEVPWVLEEPRPVFPEMNVGDVEDVTVIEAMVRDGVKIAFSALPTQEARRLEPLWTAHGVAVFSNASAWRMDDDVPLAIPELNPDVLAQVGKRPLLHACATNCTLVPLVLPLAALEERFGVEAYTMRSEQGLSGGGQPYLESALEAGKVSPTIPGEAEKTGAELRSVLGWRGEARLECTRVLRRDGHHVFVTASTKRPVSQEELLACLEAWTGDERCRSLPSAPAQPLMVVDKIDPLAHLFADGTHLRSSADPSLDLKAGMAVVVGNVTCLGPHEVGFEAYSHNTLRGAAGGVVYLAELAHALGVLEG